MSSYTDELQRVIDQIGAPHAAKVDTNATFPADAVGALGEARLLGLTVSTDLGGGGEGLREAADVIRRLSEVCGSTAMVVLMHFAGTVVINKYGPVSVRSEIAGGRHLTTLAFSESGSRSHFWAPESTATASSGSVRLDASKSWVTSANHADSYVWSSRPTEGGGPMSLWLVPSTTKGLIAERSFDRFGLRGNDSTPISASEVYVSAEALLGDGGDGLDIALTEVLPWFLIMSAAFSVGLMEATTQETGAHMRSTRLEHLNQTLAEQPLVRVDHAKMRIATDQAAALLTGALDSVEAGAQDAMLRVLEVKVAGGEAGITATDLAMRICGGAAFRKELGVERRFRDAHATRVMAPTTDALLDFIGKPSTDFRCCD